MYNFSKDFVEIRTLLSLLSVSVTNGDIVSGNCGFPKSAYCIMMRLPRWKWKCSRHAEVAGCVWKCVSVCGNVVFKNKFGERLRRFSMGDAIPVIEIASPREKRGD